MDWKLLVKVVVNLGLEVDQDDVPSYLLVQVVVNLRLKVEQDDVPSYLLVQVVVNLGLKVEQNDVPGRLPLLVPQGEIPVEDQDGLYKEVIRNC